MASNTPSTLPDLIKLDSEVFDFSDGKTVFVKIGTPETCFDASENLLQNSFEYFKTALKPVWSEGQRRIVTMKDVQAKPSYIAWLHTGRIFTGRSGSQTAKECNMQYLLARCYILGDRLLDSIFKDAITDAIVQQHLQNNFGGLRYHPSSETVRLIYDNTTDSARARRMYADMYAAPKKTSFLRENDHPAFWRNGAEASMEGTTDVKANPLTCMYREHGSDPAACYRKKLQ